MRITKKPAQLAFAGNPMRYVLSPDTGGGGGGEIDGQCSVIEIVFNDIDTTPDNSMSVQMPGETRAFTLKTEPFRRDELPVADERSQKEDWAQVCFAYLLNDVSLASRYTMSMEGATITLQAREASPDYDMTMLESSIKGITITTVQNGMAATGSVVEGVLLQVWKNGAEKIGEDYKPVDENGQVKFDVQEYIYSHLKMASPPRFRLTIPSGLYRYYTDYILKYRSVFCDKIDGMFLDRTYSDPDFVFCYALPGGLNRQDLSSNNESLIDFFSLTSVKKKFLSWAPPSRITDKSETFSLFFAFQQPSFNSFRLKANIYDSSQGQTISLTSQIAVIPWSVVELVAGYSQLNLGNYLSGQITRWEIFLADGDDNIISDVREFILDPVYHENTRYFRFRNSWGTYDSFRCTGVFESSVEHEREKVVFAPDETETQFNAPGNHFLVREMQTFKANSGWQTRHFLNYLRDFMLSGDIYEIEQNRLLKCLLTSKKTALFKDRNYNYSLNFEYERGYEDFFFQT
jgi:hypothetical protein